MADEKTESTEVTETAAAEKPAEAAPAKARSAPAGAANETPVTVEPPEPAAEDAPDTVTVVMANAAYGASSPGEVVTLDGDTARALIRTGEASRA